jgi:glutamine cyclotransferase
MGYKVVAKYPHSTENYTEGFFYRDGLFYEETGLNGHSAIVVTRSGLSVRSTRLASGAGI